MPSNSLDSATYVCHSFLKVTSSNTDLLSENLPLLPDLSSMQTVILDSPTSHLADSGWDASGSDPVSTYTYSDKPEGLQV